MSKGRKPTLSFRQLFVQFCIRIFQSPDIFRLTQSNAALHGNVLVKLVVQRLLFL
jgi:hypothetical protein